MATLTKIRGLSRSSGQPVTGLAGGANLATGFRIPSGLGLQYLAGTQAFTRYGTANAAVTYKTKPGVWGNNVKVVQNTPSGATRVIATTFAASTGAPTITVTPSTTDTAATLVAGVNADPQAAQFVVASFGGTGASAPIAGADVAAVFTISQLAGTTSGGTFTLTFPGYGTTAAISGTATGATVATAVQTTLRAAFGNATLTVTGSGTTLPTSTTLTLGAAGGANLSFYDAVVNNASLVGGTYQALVTTQGSAAAGTLNSGSNAGTGQAINQVVNSKSTVIVDLDDALTVKMLYRNKGRYLSLGQP